MSEKVKVYVTTYCSYCVQAKRFLANNGIEFDSIDITNEPETRMWLVQTTGQRTVPQIFVGDTPVGGYTDMVALHRAGRFQPLLDSNNVSYSFA